MRLRTISLALAAAATLTLGLASTGLALHDGGVAHCDACHTMHNSLEGDSVIEGGTIGTAGAYLLKGATQSEACLNCHESAEDTGPNGYHISTAGTLAAGNPPLQMSPGGDFGWLKVTYSWTAHGHDNTEPGDRHGHNIVGYSYSADTTLTAAPGGTYPADSLHCSSCHDPHGKYRVFADGSVETAGLPIADRGSYPPGTNTYRTPTDNWAVGAYRLLAGEGYLPKSVASSADAFANSVPAAMAPSSYNRSEATTQTRVAYGSGMSEWCANCHGDFHDAETGTSGSILRHPAGNAHKLGEPISGNYNAYVSSGVMDPSQENPYLSLVPFETGSTNDSDGRSAMASLATNDDTQLGGPDATSNVMCLSCHRAHASGFASMLRWNVQDTFITKDGAYATGMGRTAGDYAAAYYDRAAGDFGNFQRSLCNKCHAKD